MNNLYKNFAVIFSILTLFTSSALLLATEVQEKGLMKDAEKKIMDKYYEKKKSKILKKLKKAATPEVQQEIVNQIANSKLNDEQKSMAVDSLERAKVELDIITSDEEFPAQEISEESPEA